jgi:hypothetical protein
MYAGRHLPLPQLVARVQGIIGIGHIMGDMYGHIQAASHAVVFLRAVAVLICDPERSLAPQDDGRAWKERAEAAKPASINQPSMHTHERRVGATDCAVRQIEAQARAESMLYMLVLTRNSQAIGLISARSAVA